MLTGCGPDPKEQRINELSAEVDRLNRELNDRNAQIGDLTATNEDAQKALRDLNRDLADARNRPVISTPIQSTSTQEPVDGKWVTLQPGVDMIRVPGEVLFDSGKADIRPGGRSTLDKIASDIRSRFPDRDVYVVGHTDDQPIKRSKWKDNWELGAARALAAVRHLAGTGIPSEQIVQANCGQNRPREIGTTATARKMNRRVEFYAVDSTGANRIGLKPMEATATVNPASAP